MRKQFVAITLIILCMLIIADPSIALRCKTGELVNVGDSKYQVFQRCGEPVFKEVVGEEEQYNLRRGRKSVRGSTKKLIIEIWTYSADQLAGSWDHQLIFEGSNLIEIRHVSPH